MAAPSRRLTEVDAGIAKALILASWALHDIASLLGCNPGRIAEISTGQAFPEVRGADLTTDGTKARIAELQNAWALRISGQLSLVLQPQGDLS